MMAMNCSWQDHRELAELVDTRAFRVQVSTYNVLSATVKFGDRPMPVGMCHSR